MVIIGYSVFLAALASLSQAHMLLRSPPPFEGTNNSPIDESGSNYPCQVVGGKGPVTRMQKGTPQILAFTGTAVHGGGSCQVSITYDNPPTATSKFKVIHSIQGGCPARNAAGNLGNDPNAINPDEYEFKIPTDLPSGNATLAWTWLNKIGLREFYMQCASIEIEGEGGSQAAFDALPDMFIANIPQGEGCKTEERKDILYPDPGNSVEKVEGPDKDFAPPICSKAPAHQATEAAIASPAVTGTVLAIRGRRAISRRS